MGFNVETNEGVGFTFQSFTRDDMLDALRRALSLYGGDKESWDKLICNAMSRESSWNVPAKKYTQLYTKLIDNK